MTTNYNVASFRKLTPAMIASQHLAMANDVVETTKTEVSIAIKRAAPALGIDGTAYHVLDILIGLTATDDWQPCRRPLVAISNDKLAEYVQRSPRTVTRCLKQLVEAGILAYRDSPTGRRYIHRKETTSGKYGEIQHGYGFDFSPARQRVHELKAIGHAFAKRLDAQKDAKRTVNRLLRSLRDMSDLAAVQNVPFQSVERSLAALDGKAIGFEDKAVILETIFEAATALLQEPSNELEMTCEGVISDLPYNHTNNQTIKKSNDEIHLADDNRSKLSDAEQPSRRISPEESEICRPHNKPNPKNHLSVPKSELTNLTSVSIGLINAATPQTRNLLGTGFSSWSELVLAGDTLRLAIGVSETGWNHAVASLGAKMASSVLVVTVEKTLRNPLSISKPAEYFTACVGRAIAGKLLLWKSLYGLQRLA